MVLLRNGILAPVSLVLLAGAVAMMLFVVLAGVGAASPLDDTYFLRADTSGIAGARPVTQWTYLYVCGPGNAGCGGAWPDPPVGWAWDAGGDGAPAALVGPHGGGTTGRYYFYMWRFGWAFYLLGLALAAAALLAGPVLACCLGRLGAAVAGLAAAAALLFSSLAAALMTATFVRMRDEFRAAGRDAAVGTRAFAFTWAAWSCLLVSAALLLLGALSGGRRARRDRTAAAALSPAPAAAAAPAAATRAGGGRWFARFARPRRGSRGSRRVSYDVGNHSRVKEEYA